ncbi:MAG TPA: hypothetical protein VF486_06290 [Actinomycetes bacterium]
MEPDLDGEAAAFPGLGCAGATPVSSYPRRDAGARTAIASVAHAILALQPHAERGMLGFLDDFVAAARPLANSLGLGNRARRAGENLSGS